MNMTVAVVRQTIKAAVSSCGFGRRPDKRTTSSKDHPSRHIIRADGTASLIRTQRSRNASRESPVHVLVQWGENLM